MMATNPPENDNLLISPEFNSQFLKENEHKTHPSMNTVELEEERKKVLLQNDTEDEDIYDKINIIKYDLLQDSNPEPINNSGSLEKIEKPEELEEQKKEKLISELERDRPSDVVIFDERSNNQDIVKINTHEDLFQGNNIVWEIDLTKEDDEGEKEGYLSHNEGSDDKIELDDNSVDIDQARNEIENQLDMIKHEIKDLQEKQEYEEEVEDEDEGEDNDEKSESNHQESDNVEDQNNEEYPQDIEFQPIKDQRDDEEKAEINRKIINPIENSFPQNLTNQNSKIPVLRKEWKNLSPIEDSEPKIPIEYHRKLKDQSQPTEINNNQKLKSQEPKVFHNKKQRKNKKRKEELKRLLKLYEQKQKSKPHKVEAAITIQKWVRGFLDRKEYGNFKNKIKKIRQLRR